MAAVEALAEVAEIAAKHVPHAADLKDAAAPLVPSAVQQTAQGWWERLRHSNPALHGRLHPLRPYTVSLFL